MAKQKSPKKLEKILNYILARHPDEFGLAPDMAGYIKVKELLKALSEEAGWGYVRRSHLDEILLSVSAPPFEIGGTRIRARDQSLLSTWVREHDLPKLLYTCVRQKAYPAAMEKGIMPAGRQEVILSSNRDLAERMGRRRDRQAVTLIVQAPKAQDRGTTFKRFGKEIFCTESIPAGCFSGPRLPKESPEHKRRERPAAPQKPSHPGSFFLDLEDTGEKQKRAKGKRKRRERPPWRR